MKTKHFIPIIALFFMAILINGCVEKSSSTIDSLYPEEKKIKGLEKRIEELEGTIKEQMDSEKDAKAEGKEGREIGIVQGVYGIVKYGEGDCMPTRGPSNKEWVDYEGDIYLARKDKFTIIPKTNQSVGYIKLPSEAIFLEILKNSIKIRVERGYYEADLDVGNYVLLFPNYSWNRYNSNFVVVSPQEVIYKSFRYFECLVY